MKKTQNGKKNQSIKTAYFLQSPKIKDTSKAKNSNANKTQSLNYSKNSSCTNGHQFSMSQKLNSYKIAKNKSE